MNNFALKICALGAPLLQAFAEDCCTPETYSPMQCCDWTFCGGTFTVGADWLYWKVEQDSLLAGSFVDDFPDPVFKKVHFDGIQPTFKYNNGFRVYAGYEMGCEPWGLEISYTYIPIHSNSGFAQTSIVNTADHSQAIFPNRVGFPSFQAFDPAPFASLLVKWDGKLSYLDVDLTRTLCLGTCFRLYPHIGFRAAWGDQHLSMNGNLQQPAAVNRATFGGLELSEDFHGYGIEGGLWMEWGFGWGFSALGHVGGSVLCTTVKSRQTTNAFLGEDGPQVYIINGVIKLHTTIPTVDYFAGLQYRFTFCNDMSFGIHAGWEQCVFFDLNRMTLSRGNFSTQGLTLGADFSF